MKLAPSKDNVQIFGSKCRNLLICLIYSMAWRYFTFRWIQIKKKPYEAVNHVVPVAS